MGSFSGQTQQVGVGSDLLPASLDLPGTESGERVSSRRRSARHGMVLVATAMTVFSLHAFASFALPSHAAVTCLGIGGCYAVAGLAAYRVSRGSFGVMRARWFLAIAGFGVGVLTFAWTMYQADILGTSDDLAGIQDVMLLLRGVPFLVAVCLSHRELGVPFAALDGAQAILMAILASCALLFAGPNYLPVTSDAASFWIGIANGIVAALATVRCFGGGGRSEERRFFRLIAGFLWINEVATGLLNHFVIDRWRAPDGSSWFLMADLPLLLFVAAIWRYTTRETTAASGLEEDTFVDTACSLFIPVCSLLLAALIVPGHLRLGLGGVAASFLLYGLRSTVVLKKSLAAQHELLLANRSIQDQAFSDALTGIPNRRSFDLTLEREWKRAKRSRQPLALLMLDVDHFKSLNDKHGHLVGDRCLREIAGLLRGGLGREADFAARYGGEEFGILLIDTGAEGARIVGESLRRAVEMHHCALEDGTALTFTVSIGVASEIPMVHESSVTLVAAADKALYRAKRGGRNRLEVHAWRMDAMAEAI